MRWVILVAQCSDDSCLSQLPKMHFALYWRTLPWDHAPGVLFLNEAGGKASRLDGTAYIPAEHERPGLLAAASTYIWQEVRQTLLPSDVMGDLSGARRKRSRRSG